MNQKPKFNVIYYKQAQKYLSKLDKKTQQKILDNIDLARHSLDPELLKTYRRHLGIPNTLQ